MLHRWVTDCRSQALGDDSAVAAARSRSEDINCRSHASGEDTVGAAARSFRIRPFVSIIIPLLGRAALLSILYRQEFLTFLAELIHTRSRPEEYHVVHWRSLHPLS